MASLGQELKQERESRNISIEEIAASTKIVGRYLRAVEEDRFDTMPGGFFIKGIIRAYAKYLGLNEDELMRRYEEAGILDELPSEKPRNVNDLPTFPLHRRAIMRGLVFAVIAIVAVTMILVWRSGRRHTTLPDAKARVVVPQNQPSTPPPLEKPAAERVKTEWKGVTIDISFLELTWLQVYTDGVLRIDGEFPAGEKASVQADKELIINVGNAGGVSFLLNGKPAKALGRVGEVFKDIRITPENYQDFLQDKAAKGSSR